MTAVALHKPAEQRTSVIATMAETYGMRADAFEQTLRATVVPKACTREEFAAFVLVARQYKLNPITREIYAIPKKGGGIQPVVGVDGWYSITNDHPQFDGIEFEDHEDEKGALVSITCRIWRKDRSRAIAVTEYLSECKQPSEPWQKWPRRMLRHKAAIQSARVAFGFSGIVDPDEAARFTANVASIGAGAQQPSRELRTIDARLDSFATENDIDPPAADAPSAAETPADAETAGAPAAQASNFAPEEGAAGIPDTQPERTPSEQAYEAGRNACRRGVGMDAIPMKFSRYKDLKAAWEEGYTAEGERMEAEAGQ